MKPAYPMRVTIRRRPNGSFTTQVNIQDVTGSIYRSPIRNSSEVDLSTAIEHALGKVQGREEGLRELLETDWSK